jgi:putative phage-type endonuclease
MTLSKEEWLAERRNHIGASDVAAILGMDPRRGPLSVYESKVHGHSQEDNDWMRFGRDVEGAIANMYEVKTGRLAQDQGATSLQYHPDISFLASTLDRITFKGVPGDFEKHMLEPGAPLELKNIGYFTSAKAYEEDPHIHHQIQLQIQMACFGSDWGSLAALFPGYNLVWKDLPRNDEFLAAAYPVLEEFWKCVVDRTPPPVESYRDLEVVKRLWPTDSGETVALDNEMFGLVSKWENRKFNRKELDNEVEAIEAELRAAMGNATWGALPDGTFLALKTTKCSGYTSVVEPYEYRTLRRTKKKG